MLENQARAEGKRGKKQVFDPQDLKLMDDEYESGLIASLKSPNWNIKDCLRDSKHKTGG